MPVVYRCRPKGGLQEPVSGSPCLAAVSAALGRASLPAAGIEPDDVELRLAFNPQLAQSEPRESRGDCGNLGKASKHRSKPNAGKSACAEGTKAKTFPSRTSHTEQRQEVLLRERQKLEVKILGMGAAELKDMIFRLEADPEVKARAPVHSFVAGAADYIKETPRWAQNPIAVADIRIIARDAEFFLLHGIPKWELPE